MAKNIDATRDAVAVLRKRFNARGVRDCFRPRKRKARGRAGEEGWHELVCVDASGNIIQGVKSVRYRPLMTDAREAPDLEEGEALCGDIAHT